MSLYGVAGYHVTLSESHMIANHPIWGNTCAPSCGNFDLFVTILFILYKGWYITFNSSLESKKKYNIYYKVFSCQRFYVNHIS